MKNCSKPEGKYLESFSGHEILPTFVYSNCKSEFIANSLFLNLSDVNYEMFRFPKYYIIFSAHYLCYSKIPKIDKDHFTQRYDSTLKSKKIPNFHTFFYFK